VADRTVSVNLVAKVQGLTAGLATAKKSVSDFGGELDTLGVKHKDKFNGLAIAAGGLGAGLLGAFGMATKAAMDFDKEMSAVGSVAGTNAKRLSDLRTAAIQAGQATAYSATDAAQAEEELAKAGVSVKDILGGGLQGALSLAAAGQMDLSQAATIAAQAMNIFKLQGSAVPHIADVLAASANKSAADMTGMGDSLKQGGLVASQFGLSLEDTAGVLSAFADNALVGSDAGTSLKTMLQALANPSQQSAALMKQLGINVYDAQGKFVGITALAGILQKQLGGLTQQQRDQALAQIFGSDAMRSANVLYTQGSAGIQKYIGSVNDQGAAADTARQKMDNLSGDVEQLKGSLETLAIQSGSGANAGLRKLAQAATGAVNAFGQMPAPVQQTVTLLAGLSGAGLLLGTGWLKLRQQGQELMTSLRDMGPAGQVAATGLGKVAGVAGRLAIVLAAAQAASAAFGKDITPQVSKTTQDLNKFAAGGKAAGDSLGHLDYDLGTLGSGGMAKFGNAVGGTIESVTGLGRVFDESGYHAQQRLGAIDQALASLVSSGNGDQAKKDFDALATQAKKAGISIDDLKKGLPQYAEAQANAATSTAASANSFVNVAQNAKTMASSLQDAISKGQTLDDVFKELHGAAEDWARGEIGFAQSIGDLTNTLKENGRTLDINTQKGRDNKSAILDTVDAAEKAAQAKLTETGSVQAASDTYNGYISQLRKTLSQAGFTKQQIDDLIRTYAQMPAAVATSINAPGLAGAASSVRQYKQTLDALNGKHITTTVTVVTHGDTSHVQGQLNSYRRWGGIDYAADGLVRLGSAALYPARTSPTYGFAEPATGGEAFIPRLGDYARSTAILDQASRWYGGRFMPGGGKATAAPVVNVAAPQVRVYVGDEEITSRVKIVVDARIASYDRATTAAVSGGVRV
jgi:TP901 family phage tail tape measure protein